MTRTEQRLSDALDAAGRTVRESDLRPLPASGAAPVRRRARWQRWLAPAAAAVAVTVIAAFALVPRLLQTPAASGGGIGQLVHVAAFPTGIAVDQAVGTAYVSGGGANSLSMVSTANCDAAQPGLANCPAARIIGSGGSDPIGVAANPLTHTVYVVNGDSGTVAVINTTACNAADTAGCPARPALISVAGGPEFLAVDEQTNTVYVADTESGTVSVINGNTCDAEDTAGCQRAPATISAGAGAFPIAVDAATNTVYVGVDNGLAVIDGARCDAADISGCGQRPALVPVGNEPAGIAIDDQTSTVYVSGEAGTVALVGLRACDAVATAGCGRPVATVSVGSDPRGAALDAATGTVYVANAGSDSVSLLNAATCNASDTAGCSATPRTFPVGSSPRRIGVDSADHAIYVVNTGASTLSVVNATTCNATVTRGCPTAAPAGTGHAATGLAGGAAGNLVSDCSPSVTQQTSGQPAAAFTSQARQVASGSVAGTPWTLWVRSGLAEPRALENGGLVIGGRWYGLCAGFPNIAEMEFIDTAGNGIAYGYMAVPGTLSVTMTPAALRSTTTVRVGDASFFVASLANSACAYKSIVFHATTPGYSAVHQLYFGTCATGHDVAITGSDGAWGGSASSVSLPGPGGSGGGGAGLVNIRDECSPAATAADSGDPASRLTSTEVQVAAGRLNGSQWSLWSARTTAGVDGVENGGLVLNGRWYGLCAGYPNPAEFELIDTGQAGVVFGFVANPGDYTVKLVGSTTLPAPGTYRVRGGTFFIGTLPLSACAYPAMWLNAATASVTDLHHLQFGSCRAGDLVAITESNGSW